MKLGEIDVDVLVDALEWEMGRWREEADRRHARGMVPINEARAELRLTVSERVTVFVLGALASALSEARARSVSGRSEHVRDGV